VARRHIRRDAEADAEAVGLTLAGLVRPEATLAQV